MLWTKDEAQWAQHAPSEKAATLRESFAPGTSMLGFDVKKFVGLKSTLTCSAGITGQSSGRGM